MATRDRILATSLDLFGTRGVDAVSLDEIARDGRRAQADGALLVRVEGRPRRRGARRRRRPNSWSSSTLRCERHRTIRSIGSTPSCGRCSVPPCAARRCSGLIREVSRLESEQADAAARARCSRSSTGRSATSRAEMDAGRLRRGDPGLDRRARLRHPHRHRHRTRGAARRRLATRRRRPAPPPRRAPRLPPRRPRP